MSSKKNVTLAIEPEVRQQADIIFSEMGLSLSSAVNAFLKNVLQTGKIPFEIRSDERAFWDKVEEQASLAYELAKDPNVARYSSEEMRSEMDAFFTNREAKQTGTAS